MSNLKAFNSYKCYNCVYCDFEDVSDIQLDSAPLSCLKEYETTLSSFACTMRKGYENICCPEYEYADE